MSTSLRKVRKVNEYEFVFRTARERARSATKLPVVEDDDGNVISAADPGVTLKTWLRVRKDVSLLRSSITHARIVAGELVEHRNGKLGGDHRNEVDFEIEELEEAAVKGANAVAVYARDLDYFPPSTGPRLVQPFDRHPVGLRRTGEMTHTAPPPRAHDCVCTVVVRSDASPRYCVRATPWRVLFECPLVRGIHL